MVIDTGLPTGAFTDLIASHGEHIDLVKFGWGTALVTKDLDRKTAALKDAGVGFYFGGTLFEHFVWSGRLADYLALVERSGATHIEVSNGTIPLDQNAKASYVRRLAGMRPILSEVGYKDADRSALLTPSDWVDALQSPGVRAVRFEGTAEQHRTIFLADPSSNAIEFKNYDDPRLQY